MVEMYPALHKPEDPVSPRMNTLLRKPYRVQELAAMGVVRRWEQARAAAVIGECGTGKTLIALAAIHCHSEGRPHATLAIVPGHLIAKMAREAFQTIPRIRVFFIDALRDRVRDGSRCGVNEVRLRHGKIVRDGFHTTLADLRLRKNYKSARERWEREIKEARDSEALTTLFTRERVRLYRTSLSYSAIGSMRRTRCTMAGSPPT